MLRTAGLIIVLVVIVLVLKSRRGAEMTHVAKLKGSIGSLEADQQVLAELRKAGGDLAKATEVNYYLYFHDRSAADSAAIHAGSGPLVATVHRARGDSAWLCFVSGTMVPSEAAIHAHTVRLAKIARQYGGEYDGWEAALTK